MKPQHHSSSASRDTRLYDVCAPYLGEPGPPFTRIFDPEFRAGLATQRDKVASLQQHLAGVDPCGRPPPTAAQLAANPAHINAPVAHIGVANQSQAGFVMRQDELIAKIRVHVPVASIQSGIDNIVAAAAARSSDCPMFNASVVVLGGGGGLQAQYPPGYHVPALVGTPLAGDDLAAFQAHGNSLARHVYAFVTKEGTKKANGLTAEEEELTWATVRLSHVAASGFSGTFGRALSTSNFSLT